MLCPESGPQKTVRKELLINVVQYDFCKLWHFPALLVIIYVCQQTRKVNFFVISLCWNRLPTELFIKFPLISLAGRY
jgi:hypothetical protein